MLIKTLGISAAYCREPYQYTLNLLNNEILLDCPPQAMLSLRKAGIPVAQLQAMVISHFHPDHTLGFPLVIPGWPRGDKKLPVIGPIGTREYFQQLCTLVGKKHKLDRVEFFELGSGEKFKTESGKYELTSIPMKHSEESLGYLIKSKNEKTLGWTGDTAWCRGLEEMIRQADILISDMTFMGKGSKTHLGVVDDIPKYLEFLEEDQRVILTHLEDSAEKYKSLLQNSQENLIIAEEGKEFVF